MSDPTAGVRTARSAAASISRSSASHSKGMMMMFTIATLMLASCRAQESLPSPPSLPLSPDYQKSYSNYASLLHAEMLKSYNKAIPPISGRSATYSQAGTDVQIQLRFFKLESVDAARGNMRIKVWLRMKWVDQRLQWHPAKYGGSHRSNCTRRPSLIRREATFGCQM